MRRRRLQRVVREWNSASNIFVACPQIILPMRINQDKARLWTWP
jgi:hypothetical protein